MSATIESRWAEQTTDELRAAGRRRFLKKLSFAEGGSRRSVDIDVVVDDDQVLPPPEDTLTDDFYDWLEMMLKH